MSEDLTEGIKDIEIRTVRILDAIKQHGSITAAAQALGYSQPAVSQHIQRSEARSGIPLISRSGRTITLTEAGEAIQSIAPQVLGPVDRVIKQVDSLTQLKSGHARILSFPSASSTLVPALLEVIRKARPGITISYDESDPGEALGAVATGDADVGLVCEFSAESDALSETSKDIVVSPLFKDQLFVVLSEQHPLADVPAIEVSELEDDHWIAGWHIEQICEKHGYKPNITMRTRNFIAVLNLVAREFGISILPGLALSTVAIPHGCVIKPITPMEHRIIYAATNSDRVNLPLVTLIVESIRSLDSGSWRLIPHSRTPSN